MIWVCNNTDVFSFYKQSPVRDVFIVRISVDNLKPVKI